MYLKITYLVCAICAIPGVFSRNKSEVNIFYETFDEDSINFLANQLLPTYDALQDYLDFNLIPSGRTNKTKDGLVCEHGEVECYSNRVHVCVGDLMFNEIDQMKFVACASQNTNLSNSAFDSYPIKKCTEAINNRNLTTDAIEDCVKNATELMVSLVEETNRIGSYDTLPVITLGEEPFDKKVSNELRSNFLKTLCQKFADKLYSVSECKPANFPSWTSITPTHESTSTWTHVPPTTTTTTKFPPFTTSTKLPTTTHTPSSAIINSMTYWPLVITIIYTIVFNVK